MKEKDIKTSYLASWFMHHFTILGYRSAHTDGGKRVAVPRTELTYPGAQPKTASNRRRSDQIRSRPSIDNAHLRIRRKGDSERVIAEVEAAVRRKNE
jgi:hypothetical protein